MRVFASENRLFLLIACPTKMCCQRQHEVLDIATIKPWSERDIVAVARILAWLLTYEEKYNDQLDKKESVVEK